MSGRYRLYFAGFLVALVLAVGSGLMAIVDAVSVLSGGLYYEGSFVLLAMVVEAIEWLAVAAMVGLFAMLFAVATVYSILRSTSLPRSSRLARLVERLEHEYPVLRQFDASEKIAPSKEDHAEQLKRQYVDGEISEREFEREMDLLLDEERSQSRDYTDIDID